MYDFNTWYIHRSFRSVPVPSQITRGCQGMEGKTRSIRYDISKLRHFDISILSIRYPTLRVNFTITPYVRDTSPSLLQCFISYQNFRHVEISNFRHSISKFYYSRKTGKTRNISKSWKFNRGQIHFSHMQAQYKASVLQEGLGLQLINFAKDWSNIELYSLYLIERV